MRGETLSAIAGARYDDPQLWRPIALANGIADPRAIAVGQSLRIPSLPFHDPDTGEEVALRWSRPRPTRPNFTVRIDGEPLPTAHARGDHERPPPGRACEGADRVELTLANDRLQWLDHPLLQLDTRFELDIGYAPDPLETVFVGEITGVEATFPSGGMPTVTVVAHDFLQRLTVGHQGPRVRAQHPVHRQVPAAGPARRHARQRARTC